MHDWNQEATVQDVPDYPEDWDTHQRLSAYWFALNTTGLPFDTKGWFAVWKLAEREQERRRELNDEITTRKES